MVAESDQKAIFLASEGDSYFERNRPSLAATAERIANDAMLNLLEELEVRPTAVLEIGCSNGWRLEAIRRKHGARCCGVDPSGVAIQHGREAFPDIELQIATADALPFADFTFDLVMLGFCLYLCDRKDLFRIACEVDRMLRESGHLVILDFHTQRPYRNSYAHHAGLYAYKMNYARMFTWNPAYVERSQRVFNESDRQTAVTVLRKDAQAAYPTDPYTRL